MGLCVVRVDLLAREPAVEGHALSDAQECRLGPGVLEVVPPPDDVEDDVEVLDLGERTDKV